MFVKYSKNDGAFAPVTQMLQARLQTRLKTVGNVASPEGFTFLTKPAIDKYIVDSSYPRDFALFGFAFKTSDDPAGLRPLRRIQVCTEGSLCVPVGADSGSGDVGMSINVSLKDMSRIEKMTTYYCMLTGASEADLARYGKRIVAIVLTYKTLDPAAPPKDMVVAAEGSLFKTAEAAQGQTLAERIQTAVKTFNRNGNYQIFDEVNDAGLSLSITTPQGTIRRQVVNVGYHQFVGKSRTYINNIELVTALPASAQIASLFQNLEEISFTLPFVKNNLGLQTEMVLERTVTEGRNDITVSQKSSMHTFSLPSIGIGELAEVGSMYSYSTGTSSSEQHDKTRSTADRNAFTMQVPHDAYVVRGYPGVQKYAVSTVVGLIYTPNADPKFEVTIPSGTPAIVANSDDALVLSVLGFI
ncbi:hypothetical protein [Roseibium aestuarii]|uniref:Uncharacterized protein n=1 Tax=Roseibium aestuarii TaxID=2600299 RepID=A0ABW4JQH7_9HYPH|nr:hypothetical protein [Roseibium aestuarii]